MRLNYGMKMLDCGMKSERDEEAVTSVMKRGGGTPWDERADKSP